MSLFSPKQAPPQNITSTVMIPPASPEEAADRALARQIQMANLKQAGYDVVNGQLVKMPANAQETQMAAINQKLQDRLLAQLEGRAPEIPPETRALVEQEYGSAQTMGNKQLQEFARQLAASRGLNVTDTPVATEALRAAQDLQTRLQGGQANALLNAGNAKNVFNEQVRQFQEGLRQQSYQNLLNVGQGVGASANALAGLRGSTTVTNQPGAWLPSPAAQVLQPLGAFASGIGGAGMGLGILKNAWGGSSSGGGGGVPGLSYSGWGYM